MSHVLLIEDDPDLVTVLSHQLRRHGHEVSVAFDGAEGYRSAIALRPDIILLDLLLPGLTGHQVLDLIRTNPDVTRVPVVVLSALEPSQHARSRFDRRADAYLDKPFRIQAILDKVDSLLGSTRAPSVTRV